jgi:glutamate synthase (NADPH/NADH) small chain
MILSIMHGHFLKNKLRDFMAKRVHMRERSAEERRKDFLQVNLGYNEKEALEEAKRCLQCKKPLCVEGCPVEINIPGFIKAISEKKMESAVKIMKDKNNLPAVCGRVCPQEVQCEQKCIVGKKGEPVAIGNLERYVADWEKEHMSAHKKIFKNAPKNGIKVAVIGSGPAGLTCAGDLARMGFDVTVF